jgi:diguanylate cyclase (GGDEF)-like protein
MLLDYPTIVLSQTIVSFLFAIIFFALHTAKGQKNAMTWWAGIAFLLVALGRVLLLQKQKADIAPTLAYVCFFAALACFYRGIVSVLEPELNPRWIWVAVGIMDIVILIGHINTTFPVVLFSIGCIILRAACAWILWGKAHGRRFLQLFSVFMWVYALYAGLLPIPMSEKQQSWFLTGNFILSTAMYLLYLVFWWLEMLMVSSREALTDSLTNSLNRRGLELEMERCNAKAQASGETYSIALIDIDHFKSINDTLGHAAGDEVIRNVIRAIKSSIDATDYVGRLGGDEVLVIFPGKHARWVGEISQRICYSINTENGTLSVSVSIGIAEWRDEMKNISELLRHADMALYRSKRNGRNRITVESGERLANAGNT